MRDSIGSEILIAIASTSFGFTVSAVTVKDLPTLMNNNLRVSVEMHVAGAGEGCE
jgi:hypothetical protein